MRSDMEDKLSWFSVVPHLKNMRICGVYQLDPSTPSKWWYLHQVYMKISIMVSTIYALQEIVYIYNVRDSVDKMIDSMFLLLSFLDSIYKQYCCQHKSEKIEELMDILKSPRFNQGEPYQRTLLLERAHKAKTILRIFNGLVLSTGVLWTLFPFVAFYFQGQHVDFAIWLPFDTDKSLNFYIALLYYYLQTCFLGFNDSTMDSFASVFLSQCKTQLFILSKELQDLVDKSKRLSKAECVTFEKAFERLFVKSLKHYGDIVRLAAGTLEVWGGAILFQFLVTGWIICTTAYRAINMQPVSVEFFSMIFYMCCILMQLFLYCFYGNEVTYESKKLTNSVYTMNWLETSVSQRRSLIIFMERIKRPIEPKAGSLIPLSTSTFIEILKSSYTFYTVLKTTE